MRREYQGYLEWTERSACLNEDVNLFYPIGRKPTGAEKAYCGRCPVAVECLEHALDTNETDGIWGGRTPAERRELARDPAARMRAIDELIARDLPGATTTTKKKETIMAEDLHGEPIGDERVTYGNPPQLASVPTPAAVAAAPLPPDAAAAARLLARTEGHPDRTIRSARRIAAQALLHLNELVIQHEALGRTVARSLEAVSTATPPKETDPPAVRQKKASTKEPSSGPASKDVRAWAAKNGIEVTQYGRVPKTVIEAYLAAKGGDSDE